MQVKSVKFLKGSVNLNKHNHDFHQIIFVKKGEIKVTLDGNEEALTSGSLLILSRFEEHSIEIASDECERYVLLISPEFTVLDKEDYALTSVLVNRIKGFKNNIGTASKHTNFELILSDMLREYSAKDVFYEKQLDALFHSFLIQLYRLTPENFSNDPQANISIVKKIQEQFERNYSESFSLSNLASEYHVSISHLAHIFKSVTGYAPIDYLTICRLNAAKKYLSTTVIPIKEIVDICGFGDESNFSRMFKIKIGMTPSAYRKLYLIK